MSEPNNTAMPQHSSTPCFKAMWPKKKLLLNNVILLAQH